MRNFTIGDLARVTATKVPTIRYYENAGLLPKPARTSGNHRLYGDDDLRRLEFIRHCRDLGLPLHDIAALIDLRTRPEQPCGAANDVVRKHLADVENRIARLERLRDELRRIAEADCSGPVADCEVIDALADHGKCGCEHLVEHAPAAQLR
jgi:DNA-binding transcriptional MerR regulator